MSAVDPTGRDPLDPRFEPEVQRGENRELEASLLRALFEEGQGTESEGPTESAHVSGAAQDWDELLSRPGAERELADLREFLATCRTALAPTLGDTDRLAQSVLARTTQDDPSWRGDWVLVRRFLAQRWRASWLLRAAAASLVLHLAALPLLAYFGFVRQEPPFTVSFAPRPELPAASPLEPERELLPAETGSLPDVLPGSLSGSGPVRDELAIENARRWARHHLVRWAEGSDSPLPAVDSDARPANEVTLWLAERGSYLSAGPARPAGGASSAAEIPVPVHPVARAVRLELLMDRFLVERALPQGFAAAVADLLSAASGAEAWSMGRMDPVRAFQLRSLLRARSYGLLDGREERRLTEVLPEGAALAWDPLAPSAPLDAKHLRALAEAAPEELAADPVGQAWRAAAE